LVGVNGVPSCANDYLINQVVRKAWKRDDVLGNELLVVAFLLLDASSADSICAALL
jgi:hypothetical protein